MSTHRRISVSFNGDGEGVELLSWGQWELWEGMVRLGTWMPVTFTIPLPPDSTVEDVAALLQFQVGRYQTMRTRLRYDADGPKQVVASAGEIELEIVDTDDSDPDLPTVVEEVGRRQRDTPYDFETDWPLRMAVVRHRGAATHRVATFCRMISDGAGAAALDADLADWEAGRPVGPPPAMQPLEQARWQRSPAGQRHCESALRYWERWLRTIPARRFRDSSDQRQPRYWQVGFTSPATDLAVRAIAARAKVDTAPVLLTVFSVALARVAGVDPVVTRVIVGNRFRPELADVVCPLAQTGLLVVEPAGLTFDQALLHTRRRAIAGYKYAYHDAAQLYELVDRVGKERGEKIHIGCFFNDRRGESAGEVASAPTGEQIRAALPHTVLRWERQRDAPFEELFFHLNNVPDTLDVTVEADTRYLSPPDIERLLREVEAVAVAAALDPAAPTPVLPAR